jgi:hypothetical protein
VRGWWRWVARLVAINDFAAKNPLLRTRAGRPSLRQGRGSGCLRPRVPRRSPNRCLRQGWSFCTTGRGGGEVRDPSAYRTCTREVRTFHRPGQTMRSGARLVEPFRAVPSVEVRCEAGGPSRASPTRKCVVEWVHEMDGAGEMDSDHRRDSRRSARPHSLVWVLLREPGTLISACRVSGAPRSTSEGRVRGWWNRSEACSVLAVCGGAF